MVISPGTDTNNSSAGRRRALFLSSTAAAALLIAGPSTAQETIVDEDTTLTADGNPYAGIELRDGASLTGTGLVINQSSNDRGIRITDGNADLAGGEITQSGTTTYVLGVEALGGTADLSDMTITIDGATSAAGLFANGDGVEITGDGLEIAVEASGSTTGTPAAGVINRNGIIRTSNSSIAVKGETVYGLLASGSGSEIYSSNDTITTSGDSGWGAFAWSGTSGTGSIAIDGGSITTDGTYAYGLLSQEVGSSIVTSGGLDVRTQGQQAIGAYSAWGGSLQLSDTTIATNGDQAIGIYVHQGDVSIDGGSVTTVGPRSAAVQIYDSGTFTASNTELAAEDGRAIQVTNGGTVNLSSTTIRSSGSTLLASFSTAGGVTFNLGDGVVATENNGRLLEVSRSGEGSGGWVQLNLDAGSVTSGDIVDEDPATGAGGTDVVLGEGASWTGMLRGVRHFTSESGGSVDFAEEVDFSGDLTANGTDYAFSDQGGRIGGNVYLSGGSTTTGGTMENRIDVEGNADVDEDSILGGNWTIAGNLYNRGTIAPGNSIGRVTVDGDLTLGPDSLLDMEIGGDDADLVEVGGTADLDGSVRVTPLAGAQIGTDYTILEASSLVGEFAAVEVAEDMLFVDATLGYNPNTAFVTFDRNDVAFASAAATSNQRSVAGALDGIAASGPLASAVAFTTESGAQQAFDRLSGEIHASTMAALVEDSDHLRNAAINRLRAASGGIGAAGTPMMAFAPHAGDGDAIAAEEGVTIWGGGFGSWTDLDGSGGVSDISTTTGGFLLGADTAAGDWRLGMMAGVSDTDIDGSSASASITNIHLGAYAGAEWGAIAFRSGLAHTWHDIEVDRAVVAGSLSERLESDYDAETFQAFAELGYRIDTEAVALEPFVNVAYVDFDGDGYDEGDGAAALSGSGGSMETTLTTLGLRASTDVDLGGLNDAMVSGMIGWRHAFGDTGASLSHGFATGDSFGVKGTGIAEDALLLEAGLDYDLSETARFGIATNGQFGSGVEEFGLTARVGITF